MHVTVYTDAGFNHQKNEGSYAYSLVCDVFRVSKSGRIPKHLGFKTNHYCEMLALGGGILAASRIPGVTSISAHTDSLTCVKFFYSKPPNCSDNLIGIANRILSDMRILGIKLTVKHVKGHQTNNSSGARMNNHVDQLARKSLKK